VARQFVALWPEAPCRQEGERPPRSVNGSPVVAGAGCWSALPVGSAVDGADGAVAALLGGSGADVPPFVWSVGLGDPGALPASVVVGQSRWVLEQSAAGASA
jgi:hypothetical protein